MTTSPLASLSPREREVLALVLAGYSGTQIAAQLPPLRRRTGQAHISRNAVKTHIDHIYAKLDISELDGSRCRHRLFAWALAHGVLRICVGDDAPGQFGDVSW